MKVSRKLLCILTVMLSLVTVSVLEYKRGGAVLNDINFWVDERNAAARQKSTVTPKRRGASLSQQDVDGVEKFVFFVGNARSGSSIVGSMMDAHPNMIIGNAECKVFTNWLRGPEVKLNKSDFFNALYRCSVDCSTTGVRSLEHKERKGYSLAIPSSWQGRFTKLRVIGNKKAGGTTRYYLNSSSLFVKKCQQLVNTYPSM